jgi:hypothetical protein
LISTVRRLAVISRFFFSYGRRLVTFPHFSDLPKPSKTCQGRSARLAELQ